MPEILLLFIGTKLFKLKILINSISNLPPKRAL